MADTNSPSLVDSGPTKAYFYSRPATEHQKQSLIEAIERKNPSKVSLALQTLINYEITKDFVEILITTLSSFSEKKVVRMVHCLLTEIATRNNLGTSPDVRTAITSLSKEISLKELGRRVCAILNLAIITPDDPGLETTTIDLVSSALKKVVEENERGEKGKKSGFFSRGTDASRERSVVQWACLLACRLRFQPTPSLLNTVIQSLRCADPVGARHATAIIFNYFSVATTPHTISHLTPLFVPLLPHLLQKESLYLPDLLARVYFTGFCGDLARKSLGDWGENNANSMPLSGGDDFFQSVVQSLLDTHPRVFFEAVNNLARISWAKLSKSLVLNLSIAGDGENPSLFLSLPDPTPIIDVCVRRLKTSLEAVPSHLQIPLIHATCKSVAALAKAFFTHYCIKAHLVGEESLKKFEENIYNAAEGDSLLSEGHPLQSLHPILVNIFHNTHSTSVRTQALRALLCITLPPSSSLPSYTSLEPRENPPSLLYSPEFIYDFFFQHLSLPPENSLPYDSLVLIFEEVLQKVIEVQTFSTTALGLVYLWFHFTPSKVHFNTVSTIWMTIMKYGLRGKSLVLSNIFRILDSSTHPSHHNIMLNLKNLIYTFLGENGNFITDEFPERHADKTPDNFEIEDSTPLQNQPLKSILLRLQNAIVFSTFSTRVICVNSMGIIGLRSSMFFQSMVNDFFKSLVVDTSVGLNSYLFPFLNLFQQIKKSRREFFDLLLRMGNTVDLEQITHVYNEHEQIISTIQIFCNVPRGFCSMGPETKPYLKLYWDQKK